MNAASVDRRFDDLAVGQAERLVHRVTTEDIASFAVVSGDHNPLHMDPEYAATTELRTPIAHGMFLGALVSRFIGMTLPGTYSLLLKEELTFRQPVRAGDEVVLQGTIGQKSEATRLVVLDLVLTVGDAIVADGRAHVRLLEKT